MVSVYVREQHRYTQGALQELFACSEEKIIAIIKLLKTYGVLKAVKSSDSQRDLTDLADEDVDIADVTADDREHFYVFVYVGVISLKGYVIKAYPKYIKYNPSPAKELKQVLQVIRKYSSKEEALPLYNTDQGVSVFNILAVMVTLLYDYYEHGSYNKEQELLELNGSGEILWERTINDAFTLLSHNRPYYTELVTKRRVADDYDFFKRLHECILSQCSRVLKEADLLELFDLTAVELSDEELEDFGDKEYILYRLHNELNVQFNTHKQLVLKILYAYIYHGEKMDAEDSFSLYGTTSFNLVWEQVCAQVLNNQLHSQLRSLKLPRPLQDPYYHQQNKSLLQLIERPLWHVYSPSGQDIEQKQARDTLVPDLITVYTNGQEYEFIIFDAKYYVLQLEKGRELQGYPGIESVTKQYLYQLAYKDFLESHRLEVVKNCFVFPYDNDKCEIIKQGYVELNMFKAMGLAPIQVLLLPAGAMYDYYLQGNKMELALLRL